MDGRVSSLKIVCSENLKIFLKIQESDACLVDSQLVKSIQEICKREKCPLSIVGEVTKEQRVSSFFLGN